MPTSTTLKYSRYAVFGIFGLNGLLMALWAVNIPAITARTHTSHSELGLLLLLLGIGAFGGMQAAGHFADKLSSKNVLVLTGLWGILAFTALGFSTKISYLTAAMILFGFGNGGLDVAMNLQATSLEEKYKRPIMSSFHAFFSVGTFIGSLLGALALKAQIRTPSTFLAAGVMGLVILLCCMPFLMKAEVGQHLNRPDTAINNKKLGKAIVYRMLLVGGLAFLLMLSEGVANDWSALQIREGLHVPAAQAALGYSAFAILMTLGRFSADKISRTIGAVAVVRYGSLIAAVGMLTVIASHTLWLTLLGWGLFGLGLSGSVPQLFTSAAKISKARQGVVMSRVVGIGYIGLLAGPALIGSVTHIFSLTNAMAIPFAFMVLTALTAHKIIKNSTANVHQR